MTLGKIDHVTVFVDDLEKAEEYFIKKLGFKLIRRVYEGKGLELTSPAGNFFLDLFPLTDERRDEWKTDKREQDMPRCPYFSHIAFKVDDINKEVEELKSKGILVGGIGVNTSMGRKFANIPDADGRYWIQLFQPL